jgi:hypothetical protein
MMAFVNDCTGSGYVYHVTRYGISPHPWTIVWIVEPTPSSRALGGEGEVRIQAGGALTPQIPVTSYSRSADVTMMWDFIHGEDEVVAPTADSSGAV